VVQVVAANLANQPNVRKIRVGAILLTLLMGIQLLPDNAIPIVTPAAAAVTPTSTAFGMSGLHVWDNYDIASDPGSDPAVLGACGCEPTLGVDWADSANPLGGDALYQADGMTVCAHWNPAPIGVKPIAKFTDCTSPYNNLQPNADPILYTDFDGGRTFAGGLFIESVPNNAATAPVCGIVLPLVGGVAGVPLTCTQGCSNLSYTNVFDGSDGWYPVLNACSLPTWDHETITSGPWAFPPPAWATSNRAVYYCAQLGSIECWQSYDGGITFVPFAGLTDPGNGSCAGIHGHLRISRYYAGDDGTAG